MPKIWQRMREGVTSWEKKLWREVAVIARVQTDPGSSVRIPLFIIPAHLSQMGSGMAWVRPNGSFTENR